LGDAANDSSPGNSGGGIPTLYPKSSVEEHRFVSHCKVNKKNIAFKTITL
jgi:hypothetical protein